MRSINVLGALPYEEVREDCQALKMGLTCHNPMTVRCARRIAERVKFRRCFLVPVPSHHGPAVDTLQLAMAVAEELNRHDDGLAFVCDILESDPHPSLCEVKRSGGDPDAVAFKMRLKAMPAARFLRDRPHLPVFLVDNVVDTGHTARACLEALPSASGVIAVGDTGFHRDNKQEK